MNPPQALVAVTVTPAFLVHRICISGDIVALVEPTMDGSMVKVKVPGTCETTHVVSTVPATVPAGRYAIMDPPPARVQLIVKTMSTPFACRPEIAFK